MLTERAIIVGGKQTPESRADAEHREEFSRYKLTRHGLDAGAPKPCMERRRLGERQNIGSTLERVPEALEHGKGNGLHAFRFADQIELLWIAHRQETQHHRIKKAKHGSVNADAN